MDGLKDIYHAISSRVKSPFFGSIFLVFCVINWKPIYFVVLSGEHAAVKFEYFEQNTFWYTLYFGPVLIGIVFALLSPWVSYWGALWARDPIKRKKLLQDKMVAELLEVQIELEEKQRTSERNELSDELKKSRLREAELIERTKRDQEILSIKNEELRKELQEQVYSLREEIEQDRLARTEKGYVYDGSNEEIENLWVQEGKFREAQDFEQADLIREKIKLLLTEK